jgi:hypothetical protein
LILTVRLQERRKVANPKTPMKVERRFTMPIDEATRRLRRLQMRYPAFLVRCGMAVGPAVVVDEVDGKAVQAIGPQATGIIARAKCIIEFPDGRREPLAAGDYDYAGGRWIPRRGL